MSRPAKPGFYYDIAFEDYASWPAVNFSILREMDKTPMHANYRRSHPTQQTEEMAVGSAVHCKLLEPHKWDEKFYVCQPCDMRTKEGKAIWAEAVTAANGRTILRADKDTEALSAVEMAEAVMQHDLARDLIRGLGRCEVSALWFDELNQEWCKGRFDKRIIDREQPLIVEIKTTTRIDDWAFGNTARRLHYDAQAAWYLWGHTCIANEPATHQILAIESVPPYSCRVLQLDGASLEAGTGKYARWYNEYIRCAGLGEWPGYPAKAQLFQVPQNREDLELVIAGDEYKALNLCTTV